MPAAFSSRPVESVCFGPISHRQHGSHRFLPVRRRALPHHVVVLPARTRDAAVLGDTEGLSGHAQAARIRMITY